MKIPFSDRSIIELMVLVFTLVVAWGIVALGALIAILEIRDPTADTEGLVDALITMMTVILGALMGLLASKTAQGNSISEILAKREEEDQV